MRGVTRIGWAGLIAAVLMAGPHGPAGAQEAGDESDVAPLKYVALGDSSAAGPLVLPHDLGQIACLRSTDNWPTVAARELGAEIVDVTCSSAKVPDLYERQYGFVPPQLDALEPDTDVVTITIGANDLRMTSHVLACVNLLPEPLGRSCTRRPEAAADRIDAEAAQVGTDIAEAVAEVRRRAPEATVYLVGYLTYWQPGGCHPRDPIWARDADFLQSIFDRLHGELERLGEEVADGYIDLATPSAQTGLCAAAADRWLEGLLPALDRDGFAAPYHPNRRGLNGAGQIVADRLTADLAEN